MRPLPWFSGSLGRFSVLPLLLLVLLPAAAGAAGTAAVPTPEAFLGHKVGEDRFLAPYSKVLAYLRAVAAASDRVTIETAGTSTQGNEMVVAVLTSAENQKHLDRYREIARRLAHPDGLSPEAAKALAAEGKTIALVTCSIHSIEVGSTQMVMELAHEVATTQDPEMLRWLDDVILLVVPSINPDGQVMVVDWYDKYLGTPYEAGPMPWLYHVYVGHDDNRDFYMLTQKETQVVNDLLYHRWYPQIFLDEHQMGQVGPRMFVPPQADPLAPDVHSLIFRTADLLGTVMGMRLEEGGKLGVGSNMIFDSYWPGGTRNTAWWKNVTGLLTEVASAGVATPVYVENGELRGGIKGLPEYSRRANFPSPWPGGWWRLRDIVEYEWIATKAFLESGSRYRQSLLTNVYRMASEATARGGSEAPYAFVLPAGQRDPVAAGLLVDLLLRHGVQVERATAPVTVGAATYAAGSYVIPAAQPYRAFLLTMLRKQRYPEVVAEVGGRILPPYDVTAWSLPLLFGVEVIEAATPISPATPASPAGSGGLAAIDAPTWPGGEVAAGAGGYRISHAADSAFLAANRLLAGGKKLYWLRSSTGGTPVGDIYIPASEATPAELTRLSRETHLSIQPLATAPQGPAFRVKPVKIGLFKPWVSSVDEGWTRFVLERYGFPFENLSTEQMKTAAYRGKMEVLLLPSIEKEVIELGAPSLAGGKGVGSPMPPPYSGGLGKEGGEKLRAWVEEGGTVVALDESTDYVIDLLGLPVKNVLGKVPREQFNCPGSLLKVVFDPTHPLSWGMETEEAAFFADSQAFETRPPDSRFERRVVATYPDDAKDILLSGYLLGGKLLERRAAVVDFKVGKGRVILIGFHPQHRAQPHATFKLLFNALALPGLTEEELR
ncbi:MAG TPA: M14 family metallopeptidase [Thermoanaerobaculia bacterium]|nr:M14 family metallopeptidase [Thermoanaerobaculia bacterium]